MSMGIADILGVYIAWRQSEKFAPGERAKLAGEAKRQLRQKRKAQRKARLRARGKA